MRVGFCALAVALSVLLAACGDSESSDTGVGQTQIGAFVLDPDLNGDGTVSSIDLAIAGSCVGKNLATTPQCRCADTDGDNDVDLADVNFVRANLRRTGYPTGPNPCVADPRDVDDDRDGFTENQGDCDDTNAAIRPGANERCNNVDDDCDQAVDEGFVLGGACSAGVGPCERTGVTVCSTDGSSTTCSATPGAGTTEKCNAIDDDCDGVVDDGFSLGAPCTAGQGVCQRDGFTVCTADGTGTMCNATPGTASSETCNGADDDCDGTVDDGFDVGTSCTAGVGACERTGAKVCTPDGSATECAAVAGTPAAEICNGLDENCDGVPDDGFDLGTPCSAGVGACARNGSKVCSADGTQTECDAVPGQPDLEVCGNGVDEDCDGTDLLCATRVTITSPANLSVVTDALVDVSGTVDAAALTVECNGFSTLKQGDTFSGVVGLLEGRNPVSCVARAASGNAGVDTVQIVRDNTPPIVVIESPPDGFVTSNSLIDITGSVADVASAAVEVSEMKVSVNGIEAAVMNRAFAAPRFLLQPGQNTIVATGMDAAGNVGTAQINVTLLTQGQEFLQELSGNSQGGTIGLPLATPLVARVVDRRGSPVANRSVKFEVTRGDGMVEALGEKAQTIEVKTDDNGIASVAFTLGTRVGAGNNQVTASVMGIPGGIIFCASSSGLRPERIVSVSGSNQTGAIGTNLPVPLITMVTDLLGNPVPGVTVTYEVAEGGGSIAGGTTFDDVTDADGQAAAVLTLGPAEGINNNIVTARFQDLLESPATFVASALATAPEPGTSVSGLVLDNQDDPVPDVTASIIGTTLTAITDAQGRFSIPGVPVGAIKLHIDGRTTTRPGTWPVLEFEINTVCGRDNTAGMPIRLLPIDLPNGKMVGGDQDVTIQMAGVPGAELTVFKNSVTFPDGSKTGIVSFTQVHTDKVPMIAPLGSNFMLAFTVQPPGTKFDPPARLAIPNPGMPPGTVVEMFSFDHDINEFVSIGTASVTEDGTQLMSNPGFGIRKAGWGGCVPPPPPPTCVGGCDDGNACTADSCVDGSCQHTPTNEGGKCDDGSGCSVAICQGGSCVTQSQEPDGTPCTDNDQCTEDDQCQGGACVGTDIECDDGDDCTEDTCNPSVGCEFPANSDPCDDGDPCTENDTCSQGACAGEPKTCDDDNVCTDDTCDASGMCVHMPAMEGERCDDGSECAVKRCMMGTCTDVSMEADGMSCDDMDKCTEPDMCMGGECKGEEIDTSRVTDDLSLAGDVRLDPSILAKLNNGLHAIPGLGGVNFREARVGISGKAKDCCNPDEGVKFLGQKEAKGTLVLSANIKGVPLLGPPTISKEIDFGVVIVTVDFEVGVRFDVDLRINAEIGKRFDACDTGEDCLFGEANASLDPQLRATFEAIACLETLWTSTRCAGLTVTPLALRANIRTGWRYNKPSCASGSDFHLTLGRVVARAEFSLDVPAAARRIVIEFEIFSGFTVF